LEDHDMTVIPKLTRRHPYPVKRSRTIAETAPTVRRAPAVDGSEGTTWRFLKCRYCGCTDHNPCQTDLGPCCWVVQPTHKRDGVCSAPKCVLAFDRDKKQARRATRSAAEV
jgi:hypothetical protein